MIVESFVVALGGLQLRLLHVCFHRESLLSSVVGHICSTHLDVLVHHQYAHVCTECLPYSLVQNPALTAWRGASAFAAGDNYWQCVRSKQQYDEQGPSVGRRDR